MKIDLSKTYLLGMLLGLIFSLHSLNANDHTLSPYNIFDIQNVAEVSISDDGQFIAYTLSLPRPFSDDPGPVYNELYVFDTGTGESVPLITGKNSLNSIGWTPDGHISFRFTGSGANGFQVFTINPRNGKPEQLTRFDRPIISYEFIDEDNLAFVALSETDTLKQELNEKGFNIEIYEEEYRDRNLYVYDLLTHKTRQLTQDVSVFDFTIAPDGRFAAAAIAEKNLVDYYYMFKRIHLVDLESGENSRIMENPGKLGNMAWSPNGKKLAFIAASSVHDAVAGSLFVIDVPTGKEFKELRNFAEGMRASVINVQWKDNNTMLYVSEEGTDMVLSEQEVNQDSRKILIEPEKAVFRSFSLSDNMVAFSGNTKEHPNELFAFDMSSGRIKKLTTHNPWLKDIKLGKQEKIIYDARDGLDIEAVLIYPVDYQPGTSYPLITYIHGGPEAAVQNGWVTNYNMWGQVAAANGYFVFMPNYRAGSGRGIDFTMEGFGDLAGKEYDDVLDGIDHLINKGYVDKNKVGIGGGSYGGYFSALSATRNTERFAASVVFVGISNQISKRNTTDIPQEDYLVHWGFWTHENMEKVWNASPVKYAPGSKTPTLILHGKEDTRVPPSQGLELYRQLKLHGDAPVRFIRYPGEGHGNASNTNRLDYIVRTMEWFDYYLKDEGPSHEMPHKYIDYNIDNQ